MALVQTEEGKIQEKDKHDKGEEEVLYRIFPEISRRVDQKKKEVNIEVALPGVPKDQINLKVLPTWFYLVGRRGQMEYSGNKSFGAEIIPEKTSAKYDNGLLKIHAVIKDPMADAKVLRL